MQAEVSIILTSFQMPWHLRRALEAAARQRTQRRLEIIVADDGSQDETPEVVADFALQAPFPVRFVTHQHKGFHPGRCRNEGVRHSTAPLVLFCDGDCLMPPDHVEAHLSRLRSGVVTSGYCVRMDETTSRAITIDDVRAARYEHLSQCHELRKLARMHRKAWLYNLIRHPTKPALRSTNFGVTRIDYERINGFDEQFRGWGCEDDDFGRRLKRAGVRIRSILDRTRVYHLWHPPAASKPATWREGANVALLKQMGRPVHCQHGLVHLQADEAASREPTGALLLPQNV